MHQQLTPIMQEPETDDLLVAHARLAGYFGASILGNLITDQQPGVILHGEQYSPDDYYWLARRAGHHGLKALTQMFGGGR